MAIEHLNLAPSGKREKFSIRYPKCSKCCELRLLHDWSLNAGDHECLEKHLRHTGNQDLLFRRCRQPPSPDRPINWWRSIADKLGFKVQRGDFKLGNLYDGIFPQNRNLVDKWHFARADAQMLAKLIEYVFDRTTGEDNHTGKSLQSVDDSLAIQSEMNGIHTSFDEDEESEFIEVNENDYNDGNDHCSEIFTQLLRHEYVQIFQENPPFIPLSELEGLFGHENEDSDLSEPPEMPEVPDDGSDLSEVGETPENSADEVVEDWDADQSALSEAPDTSDDDYSTEPTSCPANCIAFHTYKLSPIEMQGSRSNNWSTRLSRE